MSLVALALLAAAAGCVDDVDQLQDDLSQPLAAVPQSVELGTVRRGTTATAEVALTNRGRDELIISGVQIVPPDPRYPPDPGVPPDPGHIELIAPCVRPGESTRMDGVVHVDGRPHRPSWV